MSKRVFRNGKVYVCKEKCDTCIFHPGNRMRLNPGRVKSMVDHCLRNDTVIPCHDRLSGRNNGAICSGFYELHKDNIWLLRLAQHLDIIEPV